MTTVPAKHHQPLHNFSLPFLKWGQRIQSNNHRRRHQNSPPTDSSDSDLNNRTRSRNHTNRKFDGVVSPEKAATDADVTAADDADVKPWNLRPRRLVIDAVDGGVKSGRLENEKEHAPRKELWISLSKEEIEEDVFAFTGSRPARRPKKRNRTVQKQVDNVFPGLYLVGISADSYQV